MRGRTQRGAGTLEQRVGQQRVRSRPQHLDHPVLEQAVDQDHVGPDRLGAGGRLLEHEAAEVGDELEIEGADGGARGARARGGAAHLVEPQLERDVARLDHVEQPLGIGERRGRRVGEDGVALELDEAQRVAQARDDQRRELGHDAMGVLELSVRQERGVPGDVGEDQIALRQRAGRRQRRYASFGMT